METIKLKDITGIARKSGTDEHGNIWVQDELDPFGRDCDCDGECNPDDCPRFVEECTICGLKIENGWTCLDGGDFVCADHIELSGVKN